MLKSPLGRFLNMKRPLASTCTRWDAALAPAMVTTAPATPVAEPASTTRPMTSPVPVRAGGGPPARPPRTGTCGGVCGDGGGGGPCSAVTNGVPDRADRISHGIRARRMTTKYRRGLPYNARPRSLHEFCAGPPSPSQSRRRGDAHPVARRSSQTGGQAHERGGAGDGQARPRSESADRRGVHEEDQGIHDGDVFPVAARRLSPGVEDRADAQSRARRHRRRAGQAAVRQRSERVHAAAREIVAAREGVLDRQHRRRAGDDRGRGRVRGADGAARSEQGGPRQAGRSAHHEHERRAGR